MAVSEDAPFVDVREAARVLAVSESTVWRQIRRGSLPSVRRRGRRLIPRHALEAYSYRRDQEEVPALRRDHPMFRLVGAGRSGGSTPGARDKYGVLSE